MSYTEMKIQVIFMIKISIDTECLVNGFDNLNVFNVVYSKISNTNYCFFLILKNHYCLFLLNFFN